MSFSITKTETKTIENEKEEKEIKWVFTNGLCDLLWVIFCKLGALKIVSDFILTLSKC